MSLTSFGMQSWENNSIANNLASFCSRMGEIRDEEVISIVTMKGIKQYKVSMAYGLCTDVERVGQRESWCSRIGTIICHLLGRSTSDRVQRIINDCQNKYNGNYFALLRANGHDSSFAEQHSRDWRTPLQQALLSRQDAATQYDYGRAQHGLEYVMKYSERYPNRWMQDSEDRELHTIVKVNAYDALQWYFSKGPIKELYNSSGVSPLQLAVTKGNMKMVSELIQNGVKVNAATSENAKCGTQSVLDFAIDKLDVEMIDMLIASGAKPKCSWDASRKKLTSLARLEKAYDARKQFLLGVNDKHALSELETTYDRAKSLLENMLQTMRVDPSFYVESQSNNKS